MRVIENICEASILIGVYLIVLPVVLAVGAISYIYEFTEALIWDLKNIGR